MTNLDSLLKSRGITLSTKVHLVKNMIFPVVMYGFGLGEDSWDSFGLQGDPKGNQSWLFSWSWNPNTLATWFEELTHWKRPWCWERLKPGREGDNRGWDGWMPSPTGWTWVWASSWSWWTGKPGVLQSMGLQRVGHNWATELNWTEAEERHDSSYFSKESLSLIFKVQE